MGVREPGLNRPRVRQPAGNVLRPMAIGDLERVVQIEANSYSHPWTHGQFLDSMAAGHDAQVIDTTQGSLIGYSIVMTGVDEVHLLNLTVERSCRRLGHARRLLQAVIEGARDQGRLAVWLEVRAGNDAAQALYLSAGFVQSGLRPRYYPSRDGREDAVLMSLTLTRSPAEMR